MTVRLFSIVVDSHDPATLGHWWADVLGWKVFYDRANEFVITTEDERFPGLVFLKVPEAKAGKNRLHLDLVPDDQEAEVLRLRSIGATEVDIGQSGSESWVVMADPEGNEFCVLRAREGGM